MRLAASVLLLAIVVFFLARVLFANWTQVQQYQWQFHVPLLLCSWLALVGSYLVDIAVWRHAADRLALTPTRAQRERGERDLTPPLAQGEREAGRLPYLRAVRMYFAAGLAKYIPGTVWQFFGWFYLAQREGMSKLVAGTSIVICQALSAFAGALLALAAFAGRGSQQIVHQLVPLALVIPVGLILLQPRVMAAVLNWGLARLGRQPVSLSLSFGDLVTIFAFYLASYVLWGLALFLFANSLTPLSLQFFAPFLGVFPAAYALGLIAPFAPAGLGVREGVLAYLISFFVPLPIATVIALLTRPWLMTVEILGGASALISYARQSRQDSHAR